MSIKSDNWIKKMSLENDMISPFQPNQVKTNQENNLKLSFPKNVLSILNEGQKKDIEKSFEDYLKMELVFIYDDEVDSKLTPEYEKKNKDKGIRKNIKKTMEKDKNFNEIMGGLKIESVKFNKKNET